VRRLGSAVRDRQSLCWAFLSARRVEPAADGVVVAEGVKVVEDKPIVDPMDAQTIERRMAGRWEPGSGARRFFGLSPLGGLDGVEAAVDLFPDPKTGVFANDAAEGVATGDVHDDFPGEETACCSLWPTLLAAARADWVRRRY
jgi:hypothetical protein